LRSPGSKDEDIEFGTAVNRMLAFGVPLPDAVRAVPTFDKEAAQRGDV
jgi:hypothetical protein